MRIRTVWLVLGLTLSAAAVIAQAPPLSDEFVANTYSTSSQSAPDVAADGKDGFVVVWDSAGEDGDLDGIFGQRFSKGGQRADLEFAVNTYTTNAQFAPRVAMNSTGDFVVVWTGAGQDGGATGIFGQRFGPAGVKVGAEFPVNTYTTGLQGEPAVAMDDAGDFVVVWSSFGQDGSGYGVFAQRFAANGTKSGSEIPVNSYTTFDQHEPTVAMDEAGNFTVVWSSSGQDGDGEGVFGQRFDAAGAKQGVEFPVNTHTASDERFPAIASDRHGNFVVAWADHNYDVSSYGVVLRHFHADGESFGTESLVNEFTEESQSFPAIAMGPAGDFIITWASYEQDGSSWGTYGQSYDRLGGRIGDNFRINTTTVGAQDGGRVAHDGTGFVAVWNGPNQDGSGTAVVGRRQNVRPGALAVDVRGIPGSTDLNGVFEPGEAVRVEPLWRNQSQSSFLTFEGTTSLFYGPAGPNYQLLDGTGSYGPLLPGESLGCGSGAVEGCYAVQTGGTRPATHWDTVMPENMSIGGTHYWTLHIGDSFTDVPRSQPFYKKIETMLHHDITLGCTTTAYCPSSSVSRDQMAIFIAKGIAGAASLIPNAGTFGGQPYRCGPAGVSRFADVAPTDSSCRHVHFLAAQSVTLGCDATHYCPGQSITRDAMASFIAKAIVAPKGGAAVPLTYGPDPDTGFSYSCAAGTPNVHFTDVPVSNPFCKHIHFLWAKGIVSGCSATQYCPGSPVARDAMAKFIANGFGLQLYGP